VICIKLDEAKIGFRKGLGGKKKVKSPKPFFYSNPLSTVLSAGKFTKLFINYGVYRK